MGSDEDGWPGRSGRSPAGIRDPGMACRQRGQGRQGDGRILLSHADSQAESGGAGSAKARHVAGSLRTFFGSETGWLGKSGWSGKEAKPTLDRWVRRYVLLLKIRKNGTHWDGCHFYFSGISDAYSRP